MNSYPQTNNQTKYIGLNIHILSFSLQNVPLKENDNVRVSFTTFPEGIKENFRIKAKKINFTNHIFTLNITNETKAILLVFRRKSYVMNDPVIGCLTIRANNLPKMPKNLDDMPSFSFSSEVQKKNIYEPTIPGQNPNYKNDKKVIGQIDLQFTYTEPYIFKEHKHSKKNQKIHTVSKNNNYNNNNYYGNNNNYGYNNSYGNNYNYDNKNNNNNNKIKRTHIKKSKPNTDYLTIE